MLRELQPPGCRHESPVVFWTTVCVLLRKRFILNRMQVQNKKPKHRSAVAVSCESCLVGLFFRCCCCQSCICNSYCVQCRSLAAIYTIFLVMQCGMLGYLAQISIKHETCNCLDNYWDCRSQPPSNNSEHLLALQYKMICQLRLRACSPLEAFVSLSRIVSETALAGDW